MQIETETTYLSGTVHSRQPYECFDMVNENYSLGRRLQVRINISFH